MIYKAYLKIANSEVLAPLAEDTDFTLCEEKARIYLDLYHGTLSIALGCEDIHAEPYKIIVLPYLQ